MTRPTLVLVRRIAIALAFVAVLLRPEFGERGLASQTSDVEVLVVLDRTRSMAALDYGDRRPRLEGVNRDLKTLVEELPGTRFGLLTWATQARLELPFTTDHQAFLTAVETTRLQDPYDGPGTKVDTPLRALVRELRDAEEQYPDRRRMLVFVSDGENTTGDQPRSFRRLEQFLDGGLVLGYGTPDGAPMPLAADLSDARGNVQADGADAISRTDRKALRAVARQTGTEFVARTGPGGMRRLAADFSGRFTEESDQRVTAPIDWTWLAGLALFPLLLWELHGHWRTLWEARTTLGPGRRRWRPQEVERS